MINRIQNRSALSQLLSAPGNFRIALRTHQGGAALLVLAGTAIATLCQAGSARWIARPIGPEVFGVLSVTFSWISLASVAFTLGFTSSLTVLTLRAASPFEVRKLVGAFAVLLSVLAIPLVLAAHFSDFFFSEFASAEHFSQLQAASVLLFLTPLSSALPLFIPATGKPGLIALSKVVQPTLWLGMGVLLVHLDRANEKTLLIGYLLSVSLSAALILSFLKPSLSQMRDTTSRLIEMNGRYGIHQYAGKMATVASGQLMALVLIPLISGTTEYGLFIVSQTVASIPYLVMQAVFQSRARRIGQRRRFTRNELLFAAVAAIGTGLLIVIVARPLILFLWGQEFALSIRWVPWLVFTSITQSIRLPYSCAISGWPDPKYKFVTMLGDFIRLVVHAVLIITYGVTGAVAAVIVSDLLLQAIVSRYYQQNVSIWSVSNP